MTVQSLDPEPSVSTSFTTRAITNAALLIKKGKLALTIKYQKRIELSIFGIDVQQFLFWLHFAAILILYT